MTEINKSIDCDLALKHAHDLCKSMRHEFITPEHLLYSIAQLPMFELAASGHINIERMVLEIESYLKKQEKVPKRIKYEPQPSVQTEAVINVAVQQIIASGVKMLDIPHLFNAIVNLEDSWASYFIKQRVGDGITQFLASLITAYNYDEDDFADYEYKMTHDNATDEKPRRWQDLVVCINDTLENRNPLIGREAELEYTLQVLCRKEKNNPLHVGQPGVGKTALVYGLANLINKGKVPERLRNCKIYLMDMSSMIAGTQYRGDFEKRMKTVLDGAESAGNSIIYIDEIHNVVSAGAVNGGSLDASNMLKPYLENGKLRFIGSTTYDEYNRHFAKSKGLVRRFQKIDVGEPTVEEAVKIVKGLKKSFEEYHKVSYSEAAINFAVEASAKHISDRFLPDKAIDLIDEAGAYRQIHPLEQKKQTVDKKLIADILAKTCRVEALSMDTSANDILHGLESRMRKQIYGQDQAVVKVTEAVQMAKAGLQDDDKPLASLLFVGPTGVGKTEVARVLSKEMNMELIRFDMSEYSEKHAVAKLIGSPAGYVGYDDGGLLVDAIRKSPNSVLLLDEIEKAHQDIFDILLQVMDYARLTDNKGGKADFRNVVVIMTSNAGAQYARRASIGFTGNVSAGKAMLTEVKKTFKPEFINRLSDIVVFNDMDETMAELILEKKLAQLQTKLTAKNVELKLLPQTRQRLLAEGFSTKYGAREIDRVINRTLKPTLMREILYGKLKRGGVIEL